MKNDQLLLTNIFAVLILLFLRGFMGLEIRLSLSKKERKQYRKSVNGIDRWLFWSAPQFVKDQYSRFEKKVIHHRQIISTYRFVNIIIHTLFLSELMFTILYAFGSTTIDVLTCVYLVYFSFAIISLIIIAFIEISVDIRYHRNRYRKRK